MRPLLGGEVRSGRRWVGAALGMFAVAWGANQFVSMLVAYKAERGVSMAVNEALFGIYAVALIVALLLGGPAADLWGRARLVRPAVVLAAVSSLLLMLGDHSLTLLFAGRFAAGVASGAVFAAGSAWVRELSADSAADAGPRRAALALSAGFGIGPVASGVVAQWAPHPLVSAYVPHLFVSLLALPLVLRTPETVGPRAADGPGYLTRLRVSSVRDRRFRAVVVPAAPWVFAAPALAFAVQPSLVSGKVHGYAIVYSAFVAALTLGVGIAVQPLARRLDAREGGIGAGVTGLSTIVVGVLLAALAAGTTNPWVAVVAAVPLGAGYGLDLVGGLTETQAVAAPGELAGLTGIYFSLTYVGFALPLLLAEISPAAGYPTMLVVVAGLAAITAAAVTFASRTVRVVGRIDS